MTLPEVIPLFPLPNAVLFPGVPLPLHVFEPRYRAMTRDAAQGARLIGMVLLRGDWQDAYYGRAPVFAIGTVGEMVRVDELPDGRFNVVLRGVREFTIRQEVDRGTAYRQAAVAWRPDDDAPIADAERDAVARLVRRYLEQLGRDPGESGLFAGDVPAALFVNIVAQHLDVSPLEKQALLEAPTLVERARRLRDVLEFRLEELRALPHADPGRSH